MHFKIIGDIAYIETFAKGAAIREICDYARPMEKDDGANAKASRIQLADGGIQDAEVHWYEATGIGRREFKIKNLL